MKQTVVEWLEEKSKEFAIDLDLLNYFDQAKELEKQQRQKTIEEVFEWLTKNNYVTDLKETLIEQYKNQ
jgi:hypothetical protein